MCATHVTVAVSNPGDPNRRWEGLFLVDTGAIDCYVPAIRLREIGIQPEGRRTYELADGAETVLEIAVARIEFMGEIVGATVIFGNDDAEPLLGVTALESVGIEVDPQNQRLKRLPAVRLKSMRGRSFSLAPWHEALSPFAGPSIFDWVWGMLSSPCPSSPVLSGPRLRFVLPVTAYGRQRRSRSTPPTTLRTVCDAVGGWSSAARTAPGLCRGWTTADRRCCRRRHVVSHRTAVDRFPGQGQGQGRQRLDEAPPSRFVGATCYSSDSTA